MRRRISSLLMALVLMAGLMLPAQAAAPQLSVRKEADGSYIVRGEFGVENAGQAFSLRVVDSAVGEHVLYLAQTTADGSGVAEFAGVRLLVNRGAKFLVSGGSLTQPLTETVTVPGTVVMGQVSLLGKTDNSGAVVTFVKMGDSTETYSYKTKYDGSYLTDTLPEGSYDVTVTAATYLPATMSGVVLTGEDVAIPVPVALRSGDVDKNGVIEQADVTALLGDFGKTEKCAYPGSDVNGDGYVNGTDLALLVESLDQTVSAQPDSAPDCVVKFDPVEGHNGVYAMLAIPSFSNNNAPVMRVEVVVSWDASLFTLADRDDNYRSVTPRDGSNQNAYPGTVQFLQGEGGAAFYSGEGRNACYMAMSGNAASLLPSGKLFFRLREGKTAADLRKGSIRVERDMADGGFASRILPAVDRYGALIGYGGTVATRFPGALELSLIYPGSEIPELAALEIQSDTNILMIPTVVGDNYEELTLVGIGKDTEGDEMALPNTATWTLESAPQGVMLTGNALRASKGAQSGTAVVRTAVDGFSASKTITIAKEFPEPTEIKINRDEAILGASDQLKVPGAGSNTYTYTAEVLDQYGQTMSEADGIGQPVWSLTPEDTKVTLQDGTVTVFAGADTAKSYTLTAALDSIQASVTLSLTAESGGNQGGGGGGAAPQETPGTSVSGDSGSTTVKVGATQEKDGSYTATLSDKETAQILKVAADKPGPVVITIAAGEKGAQTTMILPKPLAEGLAKSGRMLTVALPAASVVLSPEELGKLSAGLAVSARQTAENRTAITLGNDGKEICFTAMLAVDKNAAAGLVAMLVGEDAKLSPVRKSVCEAGSAVVPLTGSATLELRDNSKPFADVAGSWAADSVAFVTSRELFSGTAANAFSPELDMSRGMLATVLYRLEGESALTSESTFSDVISGVWYADSATWCAQRGIMTGKSGGVFDPEGAVTREELALILYRLASPEKTDPPVEQHTFVDADAVSPWASEAMDWAVSAGIIAGKSGSRLDPGGTATRAEVAALLERFIKIEYGKGGVR